MSEHSADTIMEVLNARRAYRAFSDKKLDRKILRSLFEAARLAPSAFNEQPWRYLVATADNADTFGKMLSCLTELNQKWVARSQAIVACLAKKTIGGKNTENRWCWHDAGMALANLMLAATARDLVAHPMAGFNAAAVLQVFPDIPAGFEPVTMLAIGYHGEPESLELERHRDAERSERTRRDVSEFVFDGAWDKELR